MFFLLSQFVIGQEVMPIEIPLKGEANQQSLEMSGLAWYNDYLILMPQYVDKNEPGFYALSKSNINRWLDGNRSGALTPNKINLVTPKYDKIINVYQGFEALTFVGNKTYLIIESKDNGIMKSFLVKGDMDIRNNSLVIDSNKLEEIPLPQNIKNMGFESILKYKYRLMVLYEANGVNVNLESSALFYSSSLKSKGSIPLPNLEYRLTDVTEVDGKGHFWALNFFWPGERKILKPGDDSILENITQGKTHKQFEHVERLIEYKIRSDKVVRTSTPPIQLVLNKNSRNWEGLVRLDKKGFLMIVDEHPRTILAFVPKP